MPARVIRGRIRFTMGIAIYLLSNSLGLWIAQRFVPGFVVNGGLKEYLIAGILLGLLNLIVRPILKIISFPLMILTLGLFSIIINAILIWAVAQVTGLITIQTITALFWATLILAIINFVSHFFAKIF